MLICTFPQHRSSSRAASLLRSLSACVCLHALNRKSEFTTPVSPPQSCFSQLLGECYSLQAASPPLVRAHRCDTRRGRAVQMERELWAASRGRRGGAHRVFPGINPHTRHGTTERNICKRPGEAARCSPPAPNKHAPPRHARLPAKRLCGGKQAGYGPQACHNHLPAALNP